MAAPLLEQQLLAIDDEDEILKAYRVRYQLLAGGECIIAMLVLFGQSSRIVVEANW